jgi:lysozyme
MSKVRIAVAGLALSAAAFIGLVSEEYYTDNAVIPTKNDRPTLGYGSTYWENGRPVKMGDKVNPVRALHVANAHINKEEITFRKSLPDVKLSQAEYDIYMDWVYQYGTSAWNTSSMRTKLLGGNYVDACTSMLKYKYSGGYDCSIPGNKVCAGVWKRQQERVKKCLEAQ